MAEVQHGIVVFEVVPIRALLPLQASRHSASTTIVEAAVRTRLTDDILVVTGGHFWLPEHRNRRAVLRTG
jgi:hypothetical protein